MNPVVQSAQLFLLAGVAFLGLGAVGSAGVVGLVRSQLPSWEPRARHHAIALLTALPVLTALALLVAVSLPSLLALGIPGLDHCMAHEDAHTHLCFTHLPVAPVHAGVTLSLALLLGVGVLRASLAARRVARALRVVGVLARVGEEQPEHGLTIVDTALPLCLTAGLLRPRVLISRSLLASLHSDERAAVLAHERAHVRRRDALTGSIVRALSVFHFPSVGAWLVSELDVAAEQACDEEAATVMDRVTVAAAILTVERAVSTSFMGAQPFGPVAVAFGARAVERRVEALLAEPPRPTSLWALSSALGVALVAVLVNATELHHVAEFLLSVVAH